ncbi:hypothetical protein [Methanosphaera sp.]|jgi:hypothetical protein|uniref:hypothetical protein n=1 Tax=Methanosphaera sp. TaxID=2666342 RepID=UPI003D912EEB
MKKPYTIYPQRVRINQGNLIQRWTSDNVAFEDYHVNTQFEKELTTNNIQRNEYKITPVGEKCTITLVSNPANNILSSNQDIIVITATLTDIDGNVIPNHDIYIMDDNTYIDQGVTDSNGQYAYDYSTSVSGTHTLAFYTKFSHGYMGVKSTIQIKKLREAQLTLVTNDDLVLHDNSTILSARLRNDEGTGLTNEPINFFECERQINTSEVRTNTNGYANLKYTELAQGAGNSPQFQINPLPNFARGQTVEITGKLLDKQENPITSGSIELYTDYETPYQSRTIPDETGAFTLPCLFNTIGSHSIHIVYTGQENDDNTQYILKPILYKNVIQVLPAPELTLVSKYTTAIVGNKIECSVTCTDPNNINYNFEDQYLHLYRRYNVDDSWTDWEVVDTMGDPTKTYQIDENNVCSFYYQEDVRDDPVQIKIVYYGNSSYSRTESNIIDLKFRKKTFLLSSTYEPATPQANKNIILHITSKGISIPTDVLNNVQVNVYKDEISSTTLLATGKLQQNSLDLTIQLPDTGMQTLIIYHPKSEHFEEISTTLVLNVQKVQRTLTITTPQVIPVNTDFNIDLNLKSELTLLQGYTITVTDGNITKTAPVTDESGNTSVTWNISEIGSFQITANVIEGNYFAETTTTKVVNIVNLQTPEITCDDLTVIQGVTSSITASVPEDSEGGYTFYLMDNGGNIKTISPTTLYQENGKVTCTNSFSTIPQGIYSLYIQYSGCDTYASVNSLVAQISIAGSWIVTCNNVSDGIINSVANSLIQLSGTVYDIYNNPYTGTMDVYVTTTTEQKVLTVHVENGKYGNTGDTAIDNTAILDTYSNNLKLEKNNEYPIRFYLYDEDTKITFNYEKTLKITGNNGITLNIPEEGYGVVGDVIHLSATLTQSTDGTIIFYLGSPTDSTVIQLASISASNGTPTTVNNTSYYTYNTTSTYLKDHNYAAGQYKLYAKLVNSSYYVNTTSNTDSPLYYRQQAVIKAYTARRFIDSDASVKVSMVDTLGANYNGTLKATYNGITQTIQLTGGVGYLVIPSSNLNYTRTDNVISIQWQYSSPYSTKYGKYLGATATSYVYEIPDKMVGIFVSSSSGFDGTHLDYFETMGIRDIFVYANQESSTLTTLDNVLQSLESRGVRDNYRVHAVIPCIRNVITGTWYTTNSLINDDRITTLQSYFETLLTQTYKGKLDGICLDYIRLANAASSSTNESEVTDALTQLTNKLRNLQTDKTIIISACVTSETTNAIPVYGQNYSTFADNCDYLIPMLYIYDYYADTTTAESNYKWFQNTTAAINKVVNTVNGSTLTTPRYKLACCITTYKGDNNTNTFINQVQYKNAILELKDYHSRGIIFFRDNLLNTSLPSYDTIIDTSDTTTKRDVKFTIDNTTISKATASTTGIGIQLRDTNGGFIPNGGNIGMKVDGKTVTLKSGSTTEHFTGVATQYILIDLSTYSNGAHTLTLNYSGSTVTKVSSGSSTIDVTFTT